MPAAPPGSLDPADWDAFAKLGHRLLDQALDYLRTVGERPVWQPVPEAVKEALRAPLPVAGQGAEATAAEAVRSILPYATGNIHPRFFGWVHGSGTAGGLLAELLAATMNANLGGRDHGAIYVERQVVDWCRQLFEFPESAGGLLVSGTSIATLIGLAVARHHHAGCDVRADGLAAAPRRLVGYASREAHSSVARAFEVLGLGRHALRSIPADADYRIDLEQLELAIAADQRLGFKPFCVIGTAGTATTGAIDDLAALADLCRRARSLAARRRCVRRARGAEPRAKAESSPASSGRIRWPSTSTNGCTSPTTPAAFWSAGAICSAQRSPSRPTICSARRAASPAASPGSASSAPSCRAAFARSRSGSRSRSTAPVASARRSVPTAARQSIWRTGCWSSRGSS